MVGKDGAGFQRMKGAARPECDLAEIVVVADAGKHEIGAVSSLGRREAVRAAIIRDPVICFLLCAVEDSDVVVPAGLEVAGHGIAHHAKPDPSDFAHALRSVAVGA